WSRRRRQSRPMKKRRRAKLLPGKPARDKRCVVCPLASYRELLAQVEELRKKQRLADEAAGVADEEGVPRTSGQLRTSQDDEDWDEDSDAEVAEGRRRVEQMLADAEGARRPMEDEQTAEGCRRRLTDLV